MLSLVSIDTFSSDNQIQLEEGDRYVKYRTKHEAAFYFKRLDNYSAWQGSQEIPNAQERFQMLQVEYDKQHNVNRAVQSLSMMSLSTIN